MFEREVFESPPASFDTLDLSAEEQSLVEQPAPTGWRPIPVGLDDLKPGAMLGALLSTIDVSQVSPQDRVVVMRARQAMASHYANGVYEAMSSVSDAMHDFDENPEDAENAAAMEIRAALRLTRRAADTELAFANDLAYRIPRVGRALREGVIDARRAKVIWHGTAHLDGPDAAKVANVLIEDAPRLTTGQLAAKARKLCLEIDPHEAEKRYDAAASERRVVFESTVDATANIHILNGPPDRTAEAYNNINHIAMGLKAPDDERTLDQLRVDVALDLLAGHSNSKTTGRGTVNIHVDLNTLAELDEGPAEIAGFGPVVADIARQVAENQHGSEWRYTVHDTKTGLATHVGTTRRRPTADQRRRVEAASLTCVFPGCRMPAQQCDIDHIDPYAAGGATSVENLAPACRHDHVGRHDFGWTYRPLPGGDYLWTSRLGHLYTTSGRPPPLH